MLKILKKPKETLLIIALLIVSIYGLKAQETVVSGKVTDANTNEPVPFATVVFKGTSKGVNTDFDGNYIIKSKYAIDSLIVQVLGFKTKIKKIEKRKTQVIDYQLIPTTFQLGEVSIEAGENPAWRILREVWKRKNSYNMANQEALEFESYVNVDISIDNISDKFRNNRTMKPFAAVFDSLKKHAGEDGKVNLPFLVSESIGDVYWLRNPEHYKEIIKANKLTGLLIDNPELFQQFLGSSFQRYNFYDNWLKIFDRNFISPIARGALGYYEIYLMDTVLINGHNCFELKVKAKRKEDLAFNGKIWIEDSTYALKRISVEIAKGANLNFVKKYMIQQDYIDVDSCYFPEKTRVTIDLNDFTENSIGLVAKFNINNSKFTLNKPKKLSFYERNLEVIQNSRDYADEFWQKERMTRANDSTAMERAYAAIDTIRQSPTIKFWRVLANTAWEGYYTVGKIDIGQWVTLYGNNKTEGNRFQLDLRTNPSFSKYLILQGHAAYGTYDQTWKYNLQTEYFLSRKSWTKFGLKRSFEVERLGIDPTYLDEHIFTNIFFSFSTQFGYLDKASLNYINRVWFETDLGRGLNHKITLENRDFNPKGFGFAYFNGDNKLPATSYKTTELTYSLRYASKEIWLIKDNYRIGTSAKEGNVWSFKYTLGLKDVFDGDFSYQKFVLNLARKLKLQGFGQFNYSITATKIFGTIPYPLGVLFQGNETFFESERSYNMMNYMEFAADQSMEVMVIHHFQGLFFNRIPLLKRLKWREVVGGNLIFSSLNKKNDYRDSTNVNGLLSPTYNNANIPRMETMNIYTPYTEVFYGVENIFKLLRVTLYNRLTYLNEPNVQHLFGLKGFYVKASFYLSL